MRRRQIDMTVLSLTFSNQLSECEYGYGEFIIVVNNLYRPFVKIISRLSILTNTARPTISGRLAVIDQSLLRGVSLCVILIDF